jgi:hypothetical protein
LVAKIVDKYKPNEPPERYEQHKAQDGPTRTAFVRRSFAALLMGGLDWVDS